MSASTTMPRADRADRAARLEAIEADVRAVLDGAGGAKAASGRLLARLAEGTAVQNADTLDDVLAAAQRLLTRQVFGGRGA